MQVHAPVKRLAVHHVDQDQAGDPPQSQSDCCAEDGNDGALPSEHGADGAPAHADVPQHPELAPAGKRLRAEAHADAEQTDQHRCDFQRVGHRERAVEERERVGAHLAGAGDFDALGISEALAQGALDAGQCRAGGNPDCRVIGQRVSGEVHVELPVDGNRTALAHVVAPDAGHGVLA